VLIEVTALTVEAWLMPVAATTAVPLLTTCLVDFPPPFSKDGGGGLLSEAGLLTATIATSVGTAPVRVVQVVILCASHVTVRGV
jgi:hypothetical protein